MFEALRLIAKVDLQSNRAPGTSGLSGTFQTLTLFGLCNGYTR